MKIETIYTENAPAPIGPYSQAKRVGEFIFTAGQIGLQADGTMAEGVEKQTEVAIGNLKAVLEAGGSSLKNVVKTTVFLQNMDDFAAMNEVYAAFFGESAPARSAVEAARLPKDALMEIEAVAIVAG